MEEEGGIPLSHVEYHSSQPWPYPSTLMIGCVAVSKTEVLKVSKVYFESYTYVGVNIEPTHCLKFSCHSTTTVQLSTQYIASPVFLERVFLDWKKIWISIFAIITIQHIALLKM
jgi:hypothetical protein